MGCLMPKWLRGDHFGLEGDSYGALPPAILFMALPEFTAELWAEKLLILSTGQGAFRETKEIKGNTASLRMDNAVPTRTHTLRIA